MTRNCPASCNVTYHTVSVCVQSQHTLVSPQSVKQPRPAINTHLSMSEARNERRSHEPDLINLTARKVYAYSRSIVRQILRHSRTEKREILASNCAEQGRDPVLALDSQRPNANKQAQSPSLAAFFDAHAMYTGKCGAKTQQRPAQERKHTQTEPLSRIS